MSFLSSAVKAAKAAGSLLKDHYGANHKVDQALDHDLKLALDRESQDLIFKILQDDFPHHAFLGEEGIEGPLNSEYQWIVDPIDGTVNYFYGIPHFCVSIALRQGSEIILGVIYDPMNDDFWMAEAGGPAFLNGQIISSSSRTNISECILYVSSGKTQESFDQGIQRFKRASEKARKVRMMGSAALALAYIACGRLDAYIENRISIWDIAAGKLLIEAAGGKVKLTPSETDPNTYAIVASNGNISLDEIL